MVTNGAGSAPAPLLTAGPRAASAHRPATQPSCQDAPAIVRPAAKTAANPGNGSFTHDTLILGCDMSTLPEGVTLGQVPDEIADADSVAAHRCFVRPGLRDVGTSRRRLRDCARRRTSGPIAGQASCNKDLYAPDLHGFPASGTPRGSPCRMCK
jgi:hypothetical protein